MAVTKPSVMQVAAMAGKFWSADLVDAVNGTDRAMYVALMLSAAAHTALGTDTEHSDDAEGTGEHKSEVDDYAAGYAPDYEETLPADARAELESDVASFVSMAWPYLSADKIRPDDAGHNFHLSRNGHGTGFWDRGYAHGAELHELAKTFGEFGLDVTGHGDESDGCNVCREEITRITGPVQDISDEYVHTDASITDHKPGPIRVCGYHS